MSFGVISEPWWDDRDVFIIGGGKSLAGHDLTSLHKRGRLVGVNRSADFCTCSCTFTLDHNFLRKRADQMQQWSDDGQEVYAAVGDTWFDNVPIVPGVTYLRRQQGKGVGEDPHIIINGCNSGYGALCLALLKRAKRIYLLGFDMKGENEHFHDGYPWGCGRSAIYFERWAERFNQIRDDLPDGVEVFNCNPESGIVAFPFSSYHQIGI